MSMDTKTKSWISSQIGLQVDNMEIVKLQGGISSDMYKLRFPFTKKEYVCRCVTNQSWLSEEPLVIEHEANVLKLLQEVNFKQIKVPNLIAYDAKAEYASSPCLLMSTISGQNYLPVEPSNRWIFNLAQAIVPMHQKGLDTNSSTIDDFPYKYAPYHHSYPINQAQFTWSKHPNIWRQLVAYCKLPHPQFEPRLIHRDYHPTNVLWDAEQESLVGIVDWINGCIGPIGVDIGHCRINLVQMYGISVAEQFLQTYAELNLSFKYDPYWDICCLLDMCMGDEIGVYDGWIQLGFKHLDTEIVIRRIDEYAKLLVQKI